MLNFFICSQISVFKASHPKKLFLVYAVSPQQPFKPFTLPFSRGPALRPVGFSGLCSSELLSHF